MISVHLLLTGVTWELGVVSFPSHCHHLTPKDVGMVRDMETASPECVPELLPGQLTWKATAWACVVWGVIWRKTQVTGLRPSEV